VAAAPTRPEPDASQLLRRQTSVLFDIDARDRLTGVNAPDGDPAPRLYLARGLGANGLWFRSDVPETVVAACREIADRLPSWHGTPSDAALFAPLMAALGVRQPTADEDLGPAYRFPDRHATLPASPPGVEIRSIDDRHSSLLDRYFPYTREILGARRPVVGAVVDGSVVAACYSARRREFACEAGVSTEEQFRGRGLAPLVVGAWAGEVARLGAQPLYSTWWANVSSRAVAAKLGLIAYAETLSIH
jgi:hypothetical protein